MGWFSSLGLGTLLRSGVADTRTAGSVSDKAREFFQASFDPPNILPKHRDPGFVRSLHRLDLGVYNRYLTLQANDVCDRANDHCKGGQRDSTYAHYHFPGKSSRPCGRDGPKISGPRKTVLAPTLGNLALRDHVNISTTVEVSIR